MTGSIRIFEKLNFSPKSSVFRFSQGQTSKYDRLAHTPRTRDRCPHRVLSSASESQKTECCSRYSASGHLQKFAADLSLSTPQNSRPCKIFTLSLNSNQNLHTPAPLKPRFLSQSFKISFVPFNQEIVMQHFDLYNRYSILITISDSLKFLFFVSPGFTRIHTQAPLPLYLYLLPLALWWHAKMVLSDIIDIIHLKKHVASFLLAKLKPELSLATCCISA